MQTVIYADHAATSCLSPTAYQAMLPYLTTQYANPSTLYTLARDPQKALLKARETIASCIGAEPNEIYFTSGGTEADNWALLGTAFRHLPKTGRIITSTIEHHAILHTCDFLQRIGFTVEKLPVDKYGICHPASLAQALQQDALLVSIMLANNEIGTIEPIAELATIAHQHGVFFHTDAVQATGHLPIDVQALGVDMLSASAHKFNGPKGIGFLYLRHGVPLEPLLHGGAQETNMRAGTENVANIVGMSVALAEHMKNLAQETTYLQQLTTNLLQHLQAYKLDFIVNGARSKLPGSLSLSFNGIDGEMLLHRLDLMGIAVATGSACNSQDTIISHVLTAIDVPADYAHGTIRITLGMDNTLEQMQVLANAINKIITK